MHSVAWRTLGNSNRYNLTFFRILCQGGLRFRLHDVQAGPYGVWQGDVSYITQDPEIEIPIHMQHHADRLGKVIASAQQHDVVGFLVC